MKLLVRFGVKRDVSTSSFVFILSILHPVGLQIHQTAAVSFYSGVDSQQLLEVLILGGFL